jgi:hypothetical protein
MSNYKLLATTLDEVKAMFNGTDLKNYSGGGGTKMDINTIIAHNTGLAPIYASGALLTAQQDNIPLVTVAANAAIATAQLNIAPSAAFLQARQVWSDDTKTGTLGSNENPISWIFVGGNPRDLLSYTIGSVWLQASTLQTEMRLKVFQVTSGAYRAQDIVLLGNTYIAGAGATAMPMSSGGSDDLTTLGIRMAQYCLLFAGLRPQDTIPLSGMISNADGYAMAITPNGTLNMSPVIWSPNLPEYNESLGTNATPPAPSMPFGLNAASTVGRVGTGIFRIVSDLGGLPNGDLLNVIVFPTCMHNLNTSNPSLILAIFMMLMMPGPVGIGTWTYSTSNAASAEATNALYVPFPMTIVTEGFTDLLIYVPSVSTAANIRDDVDAAAATFFDYQFGPDDTEDADANSVIQPSSVNAQFYYAATDFIRSYQSQMSANLIQQVGVMIGKLTNRMGSLERGVEFVLVQSCRYHVLSMNTVGSVTSYGGGGEVSDDWLRPEGVRGNTLLTIANPEPANYPYAQPSTADYSFPTFTLSWLSACFVEAIVPAPDWATDSCYTKTLLLPQSIQLAKYMSWYVATGFCMFYMANQKPASFWDNVVQYLPSIGGAHDPFAGNRILQAEAWRRNARNLFVSAVDPTGLMYAPASRTLDMVIEKTTGLLLTKDNRGRSMLGYLNYPKATFPVADPTGATNEVGQPWPGVFIVATHSYYSYEYIPQHLSEFEMLCVMKSSPLFLATPPQPVSGSNYGLMTEGAKVINLLQAGNYNQCLPITRPTVYMMGSNDDVRNPDSVIYNVRAINASYAGGALPYWTMLSLTGAALTGGRYAATSPANMFPIRPSYTTSPIDTWPTTLPYNMYVQQPFPAVGIDLVRIAFWQVTAGAITTLNQWLSGRLHINSETILFNKAIATVEPILGDHAVSDYTVEEESSKDNVTSPSEGNGKSESGTSPPVVNNVLVTL